MDFLFIKQRNTNMQNTKFAQLFALILAFIAVVAAYDLVSVSDAGQREQLCRNNQGDCTNFCGGTTSVNTCDQSTLQYVCLCKNGNPPQRTKFQMQIEVKQCDGELLECVEKCLVNIGSDRNSCTARCKNQIQCGTSQSAQSKVFSVTPSPTAPKSSGVFVAPSFKTVAVLLLIKFLL